ncbi:MAG: bifunctional DNA-formamidopyrimidine glycosylase/DNA-(apurinic or apyrimidinic site) lyase [Planctomycetes bacterium]|nr:bifunctional DNA-formamidopyrimidine glycosylase/DNA-(apurinic or apyrimidinic site) lyase [Planctomycetota bacterium]
MPELPEVEHVARGLRDAIVGKRFDRFECTRSTLRTEIPRSRLQAETGSVVTDVRRRGKWIAIDFSRRRKQRGSALVHLGMSGRVLAESRSTRIEPPWERHEHWRMQFGRILVRGCDPRRFGELKFAEGARIEDHPALSSLGPEPLEASFGPNDLRDRARGKRTAIKAFLLDGRNVAGIGNIYACEACFTAGIRPTRSVSRVRVAEWARLHTAIRSTLERAIASGGTSLRDYVDSTGKQGAHRYELFVYAREGEPCVRCGTKIRSLRQAGRSTFLCPSCQT